MALVDEDDRKIFIYQEEGLPSQFYCNSSPLGHRPTMSSTSIEREDIRQVQQQNEKTSTDNRSVFGGSQSASVSMSINMHRIVEGVERLVESDTNEGTPNPLELPDFLRDISNSSNDAFGQTPSDFYKGSPYKQAVSGTLQAPLTLQAFSNSGFPSHTATFTSRPALPSIPSIWNTTSVSPLPKSASSPQNCPETAQQVNSGITNSQQQIFLAASSLEPSLSSQEPANSDIAFRNDLQSYSRNFEPSSRDVSSEFISSLVGPMPPATPYEPRPVHSTWDSNFATPFSASAHDLNQGFTSGQHPRRNLLSSEQAHPSSSWANSAFIATPLQSSESIASAKRSTYFRRGNADLPDRFSLGMSSGRGSGRGYLQQDGINPTPPSGQEG